jgi:hypothetical protein
VFRVKIHQTFCYVQQLEKNGISKALCNCMGKTHQADAICTRIFAKIIYYGSVWHPLRYKLQRILRNTDEGNNIRMAQPFPHDRLLVERLRASMCRLADGKKYTMGIVDLLDILAISNGDLRAFDAHVDVIVRSFPYIGETSGGDRVITEFDESASNDMRRWQDPMVAANGLQLV